MRKRGKESYKTMTISSDESVSKRREGTKGKTTDEKRKRRGLEVLVLMD